MENTPTKVILDVQIDNSEAVENISKLKAEIERLRDAQIKEAKQNSNTSAEYVRLGEQIKNLNKQVQEQSKAIQDNVKMSQNAEGSYNALSAELARLKAAYKAAATDEDRNKILINLTKVDEKLKELDEKQGVFVRNVGNYKGGIISAFSAMPGVMGKAGKSVQGLTAGFKAMSATPVITVISVLVQLIMKLAERMKGNSAAMESINRAFAAFNGVGVIVNKLIDKLAQGVGWLADKFAALADKMGLVSEEMKETQRLSQEEYDIQKQTRQDAKQAAEEEQRIAELKSKAADKSTYSAKERLEFLQEANNLQEGISNREYELAKRQYELQRDKNAQSESSQEELDKENELYIKMVQTQTNLFNKQKELNAQMSEARNAAAAEARAKLKEVQDAANALLQEGRKLREQYGLITDAQKLDEELAALDAALAKGAIKLEEYDQIFKNIQDREQAKIDAANDERVRKEQETLEKMRAARVKFGLEEEQSQEQQELTQLETAYADKLLSDEEYEQAKAAIQDKYRQEKEAADQAAYQKELQAAADGIADWGGRVTGAIDAIFGAIDAAENAEMQKYEEDNEAKKAQLEDRLNAGLISQEQYDSAVSNLDAAADKKKKELELQQAKRQKAMAIMNATLNAAAAIIASLAQAPVAIGILPNPVGIASLALATATGVAQIAAAAATPLPKASRGALLRGRSHAQGGIPIEAEGGEAIINKRSTQRYLPLLSAINQAGGGVPLYANGGIPQQVMRSQEQAAFAADDMLAAIANIHPQVAVTDINRGQSAMAVVTARKEY